MQKGHALSEYNESKGFAPILILVGILVIIGVAGGAYYFGKNQALQAQFSYQTIAQFTVKVLPAGASSTSNDKMVTLDQTKIGQTVVVPVGAIVGVGNFGGEGNKFSVDPPTGVLETPEAFRKMTFYNTPTGMIGILEAVGPGTAVVTLTKEQI